MDNGWDQSAEAWITSMGQDGDWGRQHVLDPVMIDRATRRHFTRVLDVGCGEGRFCRLLKQHNISTVGIDPIQSLLEEAKRRDPSGDYRLGQAEQLEPLRIPALSLLGSMSRRILAVLVDQELGRAVDVGVGISGCESKLSPGGPEGELALSLRQRMGPSGRRRLARCGA